MPILRCNLDMDTLLKDQATYDILSNKIKELNVPYSMRDVVGSTFGESVLPPFEMDNLIRHCANDFALLDLCKPLHTQDEFGIHYANELFFDKPPYWGSRGAPFMWAHCARAYSSDRIPMNQDAFVEKYCDCFNKLGVPMHGEDYAYVEEFAWSGMSGGVVGGNFGIDSMETLLERLELLNNFVINDPCEF